MTLDEIFSSGYKQRGLHRYECVWVMRMEKGVLDKLNVNMKMQ